MNARGLCLKWSSSAERSKVAAQVGWVCVHFLAKSSCTDGGNMGFFLVHVCENASGLTVSLFTYKSLVHLIVRS